VVDDGSTDSTPDVLRGFGNRITAVRQDNAGAAMARNKAVSLSHGKYLAFLDADDVWLPGRLARTVELLERKPGAVMAFGDYICVDHSRTRSERVSAGRAPTHQDLLRHSWSILPSAVTMRRTAFAAVGGFSEGFQGCGGEDSFMWLRVSEYGAIEYVSEALMVYRGSAPSAVSLKYEKSRRTFIRLARQRYGDAAEGCIRESSGYFAGLCMAAASEELEAGNLGGALRMIGRAMRYRPLVMLNRPIAARLFRAENFRRLLRSLRGRAASEAAK